MGPIERVIQIAGMSIPVRRLIGSDNEKVPNMCLVGTERNNGIDVFVLANEPILAYPHKLFKAAVAHEIGHAKMRHVDTDDRRDIRKEVEADLWAVSVVGFKTMKKMLAHIIKECVQIGEDGYAINELRERLEILGDVEKEAKRRHWRIK